MAKYIAKRLLILIPTLIAIIFIIFSITELTPGSPGEIMLNEKATEEAIYEYNEALGYNRPFLIRFFDYVCKAFTGDLGNSWYTKRPVWDEIMKCFGQTISLALVALCIAIVVGIPLGILSAVKQYTVFDIAGTTLAMILAAVPSFWLGLMLIIVFSLKLGLLPSHGLSSAVHYILPALTIAAPVIASLLRMTRTSMLESIRMDYIRTARAKGQKEWIVIWRHALQNAMLPIVTMIGTEFAGLLGGTVTVELVFSIKGVGNMLLDAIRMKDIPLVVGGTVFLSAAFMLMMLLVDILYAVIDPRIKSRYAKAR